MPTSIVAPRPPLALASSVPHAPTAPHPALDTLPPELLSTIFSLSPSLAAPTAPSLDSYAHLEPHAPLRLDPTCTAVSRALLPAARACAYACATARGEESLEKLGRTVTAEGGARLGGLVRVLEVVDGCAAGSDDERALADVDADADADAALERTARTTLDALDGLEHLVVACPSSPTLQRALLSRAALSARPFSAPSAAAAAREADEGVRLTVLSGVGRPVCVADLDEGVRGAGPRLRAVEVAGRMGLKRGEGAREREMVQGQELERQGGVGVERVVMEVEGHAQGLSTFLDALPALSHLSLRSFSTDAAAAFSALTPATRARLRTVEFHSTGYLHRPLCALPPLLPTLTDLTLSSPALLLTPAFLSALDDSTPHLAALALRGPHVDDERAAGAATLELLAEWVEARALRVEHERAQGHGLGHDGLASALARLEVDVRGGVEGSVVLGDGGQWEGCAGAAEEGGELGVVGQAKRLERACARAGMVIGGSVVAVLKGASSPRR